MIYFPPLYELSLVGVVDANVANRERILVRPTQTVNLAEFGVLIGSRLPDGTVLPLWDNFFWFGGLTVAPPSWIALYTGPGAYNEFELPETRERVYSLYWNRSTTAFSRPELVPLLFRIGGLTIGGQYPPEPKRIAARSK